MWKGLACPLLFLQPPFCLAALKTGIKSMALEWVLLDDFSVVKWLIAWCMMSPPRCCLLLSLPPQSHAHSSAMSWQTHLSAGKTMVGVAVFLFWPHGDKCGPVNNWDQQCFASLASDVIYSSAMVKMMHSGQFITHLIVTETLINKVYCFLLSVCSSSSFTPHF